MMVPIKAPWRKAGIMLAAMALALLPVSANAEEAAPRCLTTLEWSTADLPAKAIQGPGDVVLLGGYWLIFEEDGRWTLWERAINKVCVAASGDSATAWDDRGAPVPYLRRLNGG